MTNLVVVLIHKHASYQLFPIFDRICILKLDIKDIITLPDILCFYFRTHRLFLYSVHDSTLVPLLNSFQAYDRQWPPYCANIAIELWEDKTGKHWVNLGYCGQVQPYSLFLCLLYTHLFNIIVSPEIGRDELGP